MLRKSGCPPSLKPSFEVQRDRTHHQKLRDVAPGFENSKRAKAFRGPLERSTPVNSPRRPDRTEGASAWRGRNFRWLDARRHSGWERSQSFIVAGIAASP